jgi:hypothetical protein
MEQLGCAAAPVSALLAVVHDERGERALPLLRVPGDVVVTVDRSHPVVRAVRPSAPADEGHWARAAAETAESALAAARALGPDVDVAEARETIRVAAVAVHNCHRLYPSREVTKWYEGATLELERLARTRFGAGQNVVTLGYKPTFP